MSVFARAGAAIAAKGAIGIVVGALAVGAAGMAAEASNAVTPAAWGQQVVQQVQKCKDALASGERGIGQCVSAFANQHGHQVSSEHRATGARENLPIAALDHGNGKPNGNGNGHGNGHGNGSSGQPGNSSHGNPHSKA